MHAFDVLGDPTRRRIVELLANRERSAGDVVATLQREMSITQSAVSQHLRVLREQQFATVRAAGRQRLYSIDPSAFRAIDAWLSQFREYWENKLDALGAEIELGKRTGTRRAATKRGA